MRFDPKVLNAVLYAVGSTLVCESLAEARRIATGEQRHKIVTHDGTLIHKSGLMTGGRSGVEARAVKWDEKNIEKLKKFVPVCFLFLPSKYPREDLERAE